MYKYVTDAGITKDKKICRELLDKLSHNIRKYEIASQVILIGSGAYGIVTQNGDEPYDLDYNLFVQKMPKELYKNPKRLKEIVIIELNKIVEGSEFTFARNRRSCISSLVKFKDGSGKRFSFDLTIVVDNTNGGFSRLIYRKEDNSYIWNEAPHTDKIKRKMSMINKQGGNKEFREEYLKLKNLYLTRNDYNHSSFDVFVEAVNHIYNKICM